MMTRDKAVDWADGLEYYNSIRDVILGDWRLPEALNHDGSGPDTGYDVTGSEMGHMFYNNLEGTADSFCGLTFTDGSDTSVSFQNLYHFYWSGTEHSAYPDCAWRFTFDSGYQGDYCSMGYGFYAWAVHPGDVSAPVPEPCTMLLFGTGLIGLAGFRKKFKKYC